MGPPTVPVVAAHGGGGVGDVGGWQLVVVTSRKITEKADKTTCTTREKLSAVDRGRGFRVILGSLADLI